MAKMSREMRAKQFMPFVSLRGYEDLVNSYSLEKCVKKKLTLEEENELSKTMSILKRGDVIKITYYDKEGYVNLIGAVSEICVELRFLRVIKTKIPFDSILTIETEI